MSCISSEYCLINSNSMSYFYFVNTWLCKWGIRYYASAFASPELKLVKNKARLVMSLYSGADQCSLHGHWHRRWSESEGSALCDEVQPTLLLWTRIILPWLRHLNFRQWQQSSAEKNVRRTAGAQASDPDHSAVSCEEWNNFQHLK